MPDHTENLNLLEQTIINRLTGMENKELKELRKNFEALLSGFQTFRSRMLEKSIIHDNPQVFF